MNVASDIVAAFSGGKDSTALAIKMKAKRLFYTPTGNELPEVVEHIAAIKDFLGAEIIMPPGPTLQELIDKFSALPNHRMRWCTRMIKVMPAVAWMIDHPKVVMAVGLRADEETREGIYGLEPHRIIFPLRELGWGLSEVVGFLKKHHITVPPRTDCAVCPMQRLGEWHWLWRMHPYHWRQGEEWEARVGHTFRSPSRDTWPASMKGLRKRFEAGDIPRGADDPFRREQKCRICRL